jgi:predicted amidohydrolase
MAKTPKRLFGPAQLTAAAATKYTVPASTKTIVRHIHLYNADTVARAVTVSIGADAAGTRIYDAISLAAGAELDRWVYYVVEAAEVIQAFADVTAKVTLTVDGDELTLG